MGYIFGARLVLTQAVLGKWPLNKRCRWQAFAAWIFLSDASWILTQSYELLVA